MTIGSTGNDQPVTNSYRLRVSMRGDGAASETRGFGGKGRQSGPTAHGSRLSHRRVDQVDLSYVTARQRLGQALAANASSVPIAAGRLGAPLRKLDRGMRNDRAHATIKERMREASAVGGNRYRG